MGLKDLFAAHTGEDEALSSEEHTVNVAGMHCNACEKRMCMALEDRGATNVTANHETGVVSYRGDLSDDAIAEAVSEVGFQLA